MCPMVERGRVLTLIACQVILSVIFIFNKRDMYLYVSINCPACADDSIFICCLVSDISEDRPLHRPFSFPRLPYLKDLISVNIFIIWLAP